MNGLKKGDWEVRGIKQVGRSYKNNLRLFFRFKFRTFSVNSAPQVVSRNTAPLLTEATLCLVTKIHSTKVKTLRSLLSRIFDMVCLCVCVRAGGGEDLYQ